MLRHAVCLLLLLLSVPVSAETVRPANLAETGREIIRTFAERLQGELQQAMADGGPVAAIAICKERAPAIARQLSTDGWQVKRTSLKPRNPLNSPDPFERDVLRDFENKKQQGWAVENLGYYKLRQFNRGEHEINEFRYMKAIAVKPVCLSCHGENIDPAVLKKLDSLYPEDQARGYAVGDIRGAFSLRKRFESIPLESVQQGAVDTAIANTTSQPLQPYSD